MTRILAVGDVVGDGGLRLAEARLRRLRRSLSADLVLVNGENTALRGARPRELERLLDAGADVVTLGNHTWGQSTLAPALDGLDGVLRPYNFAPGVPGRGALVAETDRGVRVGVASLIGRVGLDVHAANPFLAADRLLREWEGRCDLTVIDFHAEATSEKGALAFYLDGRVSALFGTHTHVPTADGRVLPRGTGFLTDLGMTGPRDSVLGIDPEQSINLFLGGVPRRYREAEGPCALSGAVFTLDEETGRCLSVEQVSLEEERG